jgi:membrane protein YdbS with pleckstrin-like domain
MHPAPRRHLFRDDAATRWVWILYGLTQATITTLMAFGVIETTTAAEVVTAVALILYVALNELFVRPDRRLRWRLSDETARPGTDMRPYDQEST